MGFKYHNAQYERPFEGLEVLARITEQGEEPRWERCVFSMGFYIPEGTYDSYQWYEVDKWRYTNTIWRVTASDTNGETIGDVIYFDEESLAEYLVGAEWVAGTTIRYENLVPGVGHQVMVAEEDGNVVYTHWGETDPNALDRAVRDLRETFGEMTTA